jgi:hypothetical protein
VVITNLPKATKQPVNDNNRQIYFVMKNLEKEKPIKLINFLLIKAMRVTILKISAFWNKWRKKKSFRQFLKLFESLVIFL